MTTLYIFDKDNTLFFSFPGRPANHPLEQILLPSVVEKCAYLRAQGAILTIASNQGGVASGKITEEHARWCMAHAANSIGAYTYRYCPHSSRVDECDCRKPKPGMIHSIRLEVSRQYKIDSVIFIGDADTDKQAAEAAGIWFQWANKFFEWPDGFSTVIKE